MWVKVLFDRIVAALALCVLWPVLLLVALLVKIYLPGGPAFFRQQRVGRNGE